MRGNKVLDLDAIPSKGIRLNEAIKRLKKNPNDPKARKFIEGLGDIGTKLDKEADDLLDTPIATIRLAKKISSPEVAHKLSLSPGIALIEHIKDRTGKSRVQRRIARLFQVSYKVDKFEIFNCLPKDKRLQKRIKRGEFNKYPRKYDVLIRGHLRSMDYITKRLGYKFKFNEFDIEAVPLVKNSEK